MNKELAYEVGYRDGLNNTETFAYEFTPAENKHRLRGYRDGVRAASNVTDLEE